MPLNTLIPNHLTNVCFFFANSIQIKSLREITYPCIKISTSIIVIAFFLAGTGSAFWINKCPLVQSNSCPLFDITILIYFSNY